MNDDVGGSKVWTEREIVAMLSNNRTVEKAIVAVHVRGSHRPSEDKRPDGPGYGFSSFDAEQGKYLAAWIMSGKRLTGRYINEARVMAMRYRAQLVEISNENERRKTMKAAKEGNKG